MNHVSLFSGIGGQSLACNWLGIETVGFCEIDGWNRRVLAKHWPQAGFHDDIKTLTGDVIRQWTGGRSPDLLTASWPCQPFSVAGKRRGREDDRALWPEVARLVDETRPANFLGENVPGIIALELDAVLADLESLGYTCGAVVVPACAVNALHRRDRVWILACLPDAAGRGCDLRQDEQGQGQAQRGRVGIGGQVMGNPGGQYTSERGQRADAPGEGGIRGSQPRRGDGDARKIPDGGAGEDTGGMADAEARGLRRGWAPGDDGQPAQRGQGVGHANGTRPQGRQQCVDGPGERAIGSPGGEPFGIDGPEVAWPLDPCVDGVSTGLVRRPATGPIEPDLIRQAWADGSWELDLPRVVAEEPERRQKLQAAGNAIVPIVAYEILRVMLGGDA